MQLWNEVNCRMLEGEFNVFEGIMNNKYFVRIWVLTFIIQIIFAQFGGAFIGCSERGLSLGQWCFCAGVSSFTLVWQQVINVVARRILPGTSKGKGKMDPKIHIELQTRTVGNKTPGPA